MKKIKILLLFLIVSGLASCGESLNCSEFKTGTFYLETSEIEEFMIERHEKFQVEYSNKSDKKDGIYSNIEWIDECSYRLRFDETKHELNESQKLVNDSNGVVVTIASISGKCMDYDAKLTRADGKSITKSGTICAE